MTNFLFFILEIWSPQACSAEQLYLTLFTHVPQNLENIVVGRGGGSVSVGSQGTGEHALELTLPPFCVP